MMAEASNQIDTVYFGNPVFDISITDNERTILNKYELQLGMASLVTEQ